MTATSDAVNDIVPELVAIDIGIPPGASSKSPTRVVLSWGESPWWRGSRLSSGSDDMEGGDSRKQERRVDGFTKDLYS